jgi:hypothetical protein
MANKEKCIERVYKVGAEYLDMYGGCAQSTFKTIVDVLKEEGIRLVSEEGEEAIFYSLIGLSGGTGNLGCGSCGAIVGAASAVSLASGIGKDELPLDNNRDKVLDNVYNGVAKKFADEYHGLAHEEVVWTRFHKCWDPWDPIARAEFGREEEERGCIETCTVCTAASWAVEFILDNLI